MNSQQFASRAAGASLAVLLLASCSGSSISPTTGAPSAGTPVVAGASVSSATPKRKLARVGIKIVIPLRHHRRGHRPHELLPAYLTAEVQGVSITVAQPNNQYIGSVFYPLGVGKPGCSGGGAQPLTCTLALQAPPGTDIFTVETWDTPNEDGYIISTAAVTQTIALHALNTINLATSGVVVNLQLGLGTPYGVSGVPGSSSILITALDGDQNVIVGPFDQPLALSDSDTSGSTTLSNTSLASPSDFTGLTLSYNGGALSDPACAFVQVETQSPTDVINGGPFSAGLCYKADGQTFFPSPALLAFASSSAHSQKVTITGVSGQWQGQPPYSITTGTDRAGNPSCAGIVTVSGSSPTFTIKPVGQGICYLATFDSSGDPQGWIPLPVSVSP